MTKLNPEPKRSTAINLPHELYVRYRELRPRENLSAKVAEWMLAYVEELERR